MSDTSSHFRLGPSRAPIIHIVKAAVLVAAALGLVASISVPAYADRPVDRLVYTRGCDEGPDGLPVWFADPTGSFAPADPEVVSSVGLAVSPDGTKLALTNFDGLLVARADGSGRRLVTDSSTSGEPAYPTWSPTGDRIAFAGSDHGTRSIMVVDLDSMVTTPLHPGISGLPHWSPGGQKILWSEGGLIGTVEVDDGSVEVLGEGSQARYSPDGTRIAFVTTDGLLATMTADGRSVSISNQSGWSPVWSPDGTRLGFVGRQQAGVFTIFYIGVYSLETHSVSVIVQGGEVCDDNLYLWDWAVLQLPTFADVPFDHVFHEDIEWAWTAGVTKGCNPPVNDRFCSEDPVTRGQMAAFLNRALGLPATSDQGLADTEWSEFAADIDAIYSAGITKGCNPPVNDRFCPDDPVTRGEMAAFLNRALGLPTAPDQGLVDTEPSEFAGDIDAVYAAGVTKGCNPPVNDRFCPDDPVTRGQMAAFLSRALR